MANSILDSLTTDWSNDPSVRRAEIIKKKVVNQEIKELKKRLKEEKEEPGVAKGELSDVKEIHELFTGKEADIAVALLTGPGGVLIHDMFGGAMVDSLVGLFGQNPDFTEKQFTTEHGNITPTDFVYARNQAKDIQGELDMIRKNIFKEEGELGEVKMPGLDTIVKMLMASEIFAGGDMGEYGNVGGDVGDFIDAAPLST